MNDDSNQSLSPVEDNDIGTLRERMHVYESFDQVIAENISRAKSFLHEAAELRERVTREVADARAALETELTERRAAFDAEIGEARAQLEGKREQLTAAAQAILKTEWSAPNPANPITTSAPATTIAPPAESSSPEPPLNVSLEAPAEPEPAPAETALPDVETVLAPEAAAVEQVAAENKPVRMTIIVHGIHRPAIATGLQRYLLAQSGVVGVEPREFAEGILRLQVSSTVPINEALFTGWSDGAGMTVIQRLPQTVEVILPAAG